MQDEAGGRRAEEAAPEVEQEVDFFSHYAGLADLGEVVRERVDAALAAKVVDSLRTIDRAFDSFSEGGLALSFNGGKDCTLLLHLVLYAYLRRQRNSHQSEGSGGASTPNGVSVLSHGSKEGRSGGGEGRGWWMRVLYFRFPTCFPEETQFVVATAERLRLRLITSTKPYREGLQEIIDTERPAIRAIFMGTRHTDPSCARLAEFAPSTPGWPSFTRVNPILDWSYSDVWTFILKMGIPYCSLYDKGYTSIGEINNTKPNPALFNNGAYAPAYTLKEEQQERAGRINRVV